MKSKKLIFAFFLCLFVRLSVCTTERILMGFSQLYSLVPGKEKRVCFISIGSVETEK